MLLDQLKKALEPLVELSRAETSFDVLGTTVHLRLLSPDEELLVSARKPSSLSLRLKMTMRWKIYPVPEQSEFLDGFRLSILSRAIVQINEP